MQDHMTIQVILGAEYRRSPAVLRAMALAVKTNATLLLCSFEYQRSLAYAARHGFDLDAYLKGRGQKLEEFAALIRAEGFVVQTRVVWGHPATAHIITSVLAAKPDFVVKDVHSEPAIRRVLFTPLDWQLLRECPAPLMLVREHTGNLPRHIMAAVDPLDEHDRPHELNERILNFSAALAMQCDAMVEVVHAFDYVPVLADPEGMAGWVLDTTIYDELRALHKDALEKLADRFGVPDRRLHLLDGNPVVTLADYAQAHDIDLLVIGTTNRTQLERLVMGSTAEGLLDNLDCDVLALKPLGFREQLTLLLDKQTDVAA
ncbi:MAG: universal stress protein [Gammaproteobacteria bacterium]